MAGQFPETVLLTPSAQELRRTISDVIHKTPQLKHCLDQLQFTLDSIIPRIEEIDRFRAEPTDHQILDVGKLKTLLEKGVKLVSKCSSVSSRFCCFKNCRLSKKILRLNKDLLQFFKIDVPVDIWLDNKHILVNLRDMIAKFDSSVGLKSEIPQISDKVFGLDVPLMELKMQLFSEDMMVVGLCAPGGCGKTTLASMICRDSEVKERFKNICFLSISSSPNFKTIVQRLSEQMFPRSPVPEFLNDGEAEMKLGNLLMLSEKQPLLLVLDDVWEDSVVHKFIFRTEGYKILVTSRTACQSFDCKYSLKMLGDADAMALFCQSAFPGDGNGNGGICEEPDWDLQNKIVRGCRGLPLALKVIGNSLRGQPVKVWKNTERMLSSCSIFESHSDLLTCLASSLDYLNKNVQECFMDLGLFPEDERIPASTLIDMWVELYGIDEVDAYINLLELSDRNLINLIDITSGDAGRVDGNLNGLFVTQHDLLRDLAIYRSRQQDTRLIIEDSLLKTWSEQKRQFLNARLVSIYPGDMVKSNRCNIHVPQVEVFILNFSGTEYTLPSLMGKTEKLKVLIISNHGRYCAQLRWMTAPCYLSNLTRLTLEKILIPSLDEITMPMKNLQKISLFMCEVGQAFKTCNFNFPHMFPNLVEISIDSCKDLVELPKGLCDLVHLKKLGITNCHELLALPQEIGCMTDLEVLRLNACTKLLELPDSVQNLLKLRFLDISDCLNIDRLPEGLGELSHLEKLDMKQCCGVRELPDSVMNLVDLKEVICDDETADLWEPLQQYSCKLKITVPREINLAWLGVDI